MSAFSNSIFFFGLLLVLCSWLTVDGRLNTGRRASSNNGGNNNNNGGGGYNNNGGSNNDRDDTDNGGGNFDDENNNNNNNGGSNNNGSSNDYEGNNGGNNNNGGNSNNGGNNNNAGSNDYNCGIATTRMPTVAGDRVLNGLDVERGEWPWLAYVSIVTAKVSGACTATIISSRHLLTASHCLNSYLQTGKGTIKAVVGRINVNGSESLGRAVIRAAVHPSVRQAGADSTRQFQLGSDTAILTLKTPLKFGPRIQKVCLAANYKENIGEIGFVAGWGYQQNTAGENYHGTAQETQIPLESASKCTAWTNQFQYKTKFLPEYFFCGGSYGRGTETGDSGGPVTLNLGGRWFQVGVTSYGEYQKNGQGRQFDVGAYARISRACEWIEQETEGEAHCLNMKNNPSIPAQGN